MFGMSFVEVAVILVLALVLLGPDELPKVARTLGKSLRELRRVSEDLKSTFEQEIVRMDEPHAGYPTPPVHHASVATLDQSQVPAAARAVDPGAARAAARAIAADPGAARSAARLGAANTDVASQPQAAEPASAVTGDSTAPQTIAREKKSGPAA